MPLTQSQCINAKPKTKKYKLTDGNGLYLEIRPSGSKKWRQKYRFAGKEKLLSHGNFPEVKIVDARLKRDTAIKDLKKGIDPSIKKYKEQLVQTANNSNDFETIALEWHKSKEPFWNGLHAKKVKSRLELHVLPILGRLPIKDITAPEVLGMIRTLEQRGVTDLHTRVLQSINQVFIYAIATGRCDYNPANGLSSVIRPKTGKNFKYFTETQLKDFLPELWALKGDFRAKYGLLLVLLTFVRSAEIRGAMWSEIDLENGIWTIPPARMKMNRKHLVPLSQQALKIFKALKKVSGNGKFVFPNKINPSKCMNENVMLNTLYDMGYKGKATVHGFRATASTILNEQGFRSDVIERQLAHVDGNKVRAAYNHAEYLEERKEMMQRWADFLERLRYKI